jgi:hypothetical protein
MSSDVSRRKFLRYGLGAAMVGPLVASALAAATPSTPGRTGLSIPPSVKIRGVNLAPQFAEVTPTYDNDVWASMWGIWNWDGLIAPQLDDIAKIGNTVRTLGNTLVLALGGITLSQYLARWNQFLDRAHSLGLYVYPCGGDLGHWGASYTREQSIQTYTEFAQLLAGYPNVIGVDIVNEAHLMWNGGPWTYDQPQPVGELLGELGSVVRGAGLPITYSRSMRDSSGWGLDYFTDHLGDFLDFHVYYDPGPTDSLQAYKQSSGVNKELIIGEFGVDETFSADDRTARYNAVRVMCSNDPQCMGALAWSAYDLGTTEDLGYGLFDQQRRLRTDIAESFAMFPALRS